MDIIFPFSIGDIKFQFGIDLSAWWIGFRMSNYLSGGITTYEDRDPEFEPLIQYSEITLGFLPLQLAISFPEPEN